VTAARVCARCSRWVLVSRGQVRRWPICVRMPSVRVRVPSSRILRGEYSSCLAPA
jgi:hypothetical protein